MRDIPYRFSNGELPLNEGTLIYSDMNTKGLRLQIEGNSAAWVVRTTKQSQTIGYVYPPTSPRLLTAMSKVTELARTVKAYLENGEKSKCEPFLAHYHANKATSIKQASIAADTHVATKAAEAEEAKRAKTWTLRECFENTIEEKRTDGHKEQIGPEMEKDMLITMRRPAFQSVLDKEASLVTQADIEAIRDKVKEDAAAKGQSGISPSNKIITHTRAVLEYCGSHNHALSGVDGRHPWWRMLTTKYKNPTRTRRPRLEDVVKTLILAEQYLDKPLPGRAIRTAGVSAGTLAGLWWIVLTAQRANAGLSLLPYNIGEDQERPGEGWLLAAWDGAVMKAGQSFVLPVPERAWTHLDGFRSMNRNAGSKKWVFPSEVGKDVHASPSGIYRIVYRLAGRDALEQEYKGEERKNAVPERTKRRDLLAENGIEWWTMQDLRRTLAKFMTDKRMPGGASAILAHEVKESESLTPSATERQRADFKRQHLAKITQIAYHAESQFIDLKSEAMTLWTNAVLDEYGRQKGYR
ncbi:hypothetical protein [Hoeflea sp.]|uniref:hypothetical protein n=1 Tax=Hoeflea sp. TaxID=1940281 RepID=UPI003A8E334C